MITINFFDNGYITTGHSNDITCAQISAMNFVIEGSILEIDENAKCHDGEAGTGYTVLITESELGLRLLKEYKKSLEIWLESEVDNLEYEIIETKGKIGIEAITNAEEYYA